MLGNLGFGEIMIILLVVLLVFGAKRLPEIGASFGKGIREFKRSFTDVENAVTGTGEERNLPGGRQMDAPSQQPPAPSGEPKRLSQ